MDSKTTKLPMKVSTAALGAVTVAGLGIFTQAEPAYAGTNGQRVIAYNRMNVAANSVWVCGPNQNGHRVCTSHVAPFHINAAVGWYQYWFKGTVDVYYHLQVGGRGLTRMVSAYVDKSCAWSAASINVHSYYASTVRC